MELTQEVASWEGLGGPQDLFYDRSTTVSLPVIDRILRTPDRRFDAVPDFAYRPH